MSKSLQSLVQLRGQNSLFSLSLSPDLAYSLLLLPSRFTHRNNTTTCHTSCPFKTDGHPPAPCRPTKHRSCLSTNALHPHMHRPTHPPLLHRHRILIPRHKLRSSSLVQEVSMHHFFTMVHYRRMYFATPQRMERSSRMLGFCRCWSRLRMSSLG